MLSVRSSRRPSGTIGVRGDLDRVASREEGYLTVLAERLPATPMIRVPFLADDVHDVAGLSEMGRWLFDGDE